MRSICRDARLGVGLTQVLLVAHHAGRTKRSGYGVGMAGVSDVRTVFCFDPVWVSGGVFFRRDRLCLYVNRLGVGHIQYELDQATAQPVVRHDVGFYVAGDYIFRLYGRDLRKIRAGRAAADDGRHFAGFDAGRSGAGRSTGGDLAGGGNGSRRGYCHCDGTVVAADYVALWIRSSAGDRHYYGVGDDGAVVATQPCLGGIERSDWRRGG